MKASFNSAYREQSNRNLLAFCMALLPIFSFIGQYIYSRNAETEHILFHHKTVMIADWLFIPFNFFVISIIDWKHGGRIFLIAAISIILNIVTHAFWQYNNLDQGHMITKSGATLPAGWIHLAFASIEAILLFAFVFCRKTDAPKIKLASIFAILYFLVLGICGYIMHEKIILSDAIVVVLGLFFIIVYPQLRKVTN